MHQIERISTLPVMPKLRLEFWNQLAGETFRGTRIQSEDPHFLAEMWRWRMGELTLIRPRSPTAVVERSSLDFNSDTERLVLHIQHRGRTRFCQRGRVADLQAGDLEFNFAPEHYRLDLTGPNDILSIDMPAGPVLERVPDLQDRICRRIPARLAGAQLLHGFVLSLWQSGQRADANEAWCEDSVEAVYCLAAAALRGGDAQPDPDAGLLRRLKDVVAHLFDDPALSTATLAAELGVSPRSVQTAFAAAGLTPSTYISDLRLDRAAEWLRLYPARSVTDIAMAVGFNDSAYFSRCFRRRFGASPRDWRSH